MKLIVGLGNPEKQYDGTRHNIGFTVLDRYAAQHDLTFTPKTKFKALVAEYDKGDERALLIKPTTYYNLVGESIRAIADFYKILPEDMLIIHDDLALPIGTLRTRLGGSDAGNNGVKSLNTHLLEPTTHRLRIGTHADHRTLVGDADFVLSRFSSEEQESLDSLFPRIFQLIDAFVDGTLEHTTHR